MGKVYGGTKKIDHYSIVWSALILLKVHPITLWQFPIGNSQLCNTWSKIKVRPVFVSQLFKTVLTIPTLYLELEFQGATHLKFLALQVAVLLQQFLFSFTICVSDILNLVWPTKCKNMQKNAINTSILQTLV